MLKPARISYIAGSIGFLFIGALHTAVHLAQLSGAGLEARFRALGAIDVIGQSSESWNLFQGTSLLMGFFSMAIGLVNLAALHTLGQHALPPVAVAIVNMAMLASITTVGLIHLGPLQIYGGLLGIGLFGVGVVAEFGSRTEAQTPHPS